MFIFRKYEKGQAIVIIAAAIIALLAITALAIDAGNGFTDRRHAQTAADNAALAGALAKTQPPRDVANEARKITRSNGYENGNVTVINGGPFVDCRGQTLDPVNHSDPEDSSSNYIEVIVRSSVDAFFGPVIGINQLNNCVYAVARAQPSKWSSFMSGNAIAAMDCYLKDAITIGGNSKTDVIGGGVFSNSNHPSYSILVKNLSELGLPKPPLTAVGLVNVANNPPVISVTENADRLPCEVPDEQLPPVPPAGCDFTYDTFPPKNTDANVTEPDATHDYYDIKPGVYCITKSMDNPNMHGKNVTFVLEQGVGLSWSGNPTDIDLEAPTDPMNPYNNILIYAPKNNSSEIKINGSSTFIIKGDIIAPSSFIVINGDFGGTSTTQWIGNHVEISGSTDTTINYNDSITHKYIEPPQVELTR